MDEILESKWSRLIAHALTVFVGVLIVFSPHIALRLFGIAIVGYAGVAVLAVPWLMTGDLRKSTWEDTINEAVFAASVFIVVITLLLWNGAWSSLPLLGAIIHGWRTWLHRWYEKA